MSGGPDRRTPRSRTHRRRKAICFGDSRVDADHRGRRATRSTDRASVSRLRRRRNSKWRPPRQRARSDSGPGSRPAGPVREIGTIATRREGASKARCFSRPEPGRFDSRSFRAPRIPLFHLERQRKRDRRLGRLPESPDSRDPNSLDANLRSHAVGRAGFGADAGFAAQSDRLFTGFFSYGVCPGANETYGYTA